MDEKIKELIKNSEIEMARNMLYEGIKRVGNCIKDFHAQDFYPDAHPNTRLGGNKILIKYVDILVDTYIKKENFEEKLPSKEDLEEPLVKSENYFDKTAGIIEYEKKYFLKNK